MEAPMRGKETGVRSPSRLSSSALDPRKRAAFAQPAEWAQHEATWLSWPHNVEAWPGKRLAEVRDIYLQMLEALLPYEKVKLLVNNAEEREEVSCFLKPKMGLDNLIWVETPVVDAWIRDYGPTFIKKRTTDNRPQTADKAYVKWIFNAWGGKYPSLAADTHLF